MRYRVYNRTRNVVVAEAADVADSSQKRRDGLLKRTGLTPGEGLWIVPCEAVHCFFMSTSVAGELVAVGFGGHRAEGLL